MQQLSQGLENPVQHKIAILLREQNVAGSNPVTPTAKQVSPTLTSEPPTQGGFFIALGAQIATSPTPVAATLLTMEHFAVSNGE